MGVLLKLLTNHRWHVAPADLKRVISYAIINLQDFPAYQKLNRPFSHCLCACVYRSRGALFLDNRRDFTEMGQTDFKPLILSM